MSDELVWLQHGEHAGYFQCPASAVEHWTAAGWQLASGPPEEVNPVTAENRAWQAEQAALAAADEQAAKPKPSRKSGTENTPQEG